MRAPVEQLAQGKETRTRRRCGERQRRVGGGLVTRDLSVRMIWTLLKGGWADKLDEAKAAFRAA
jgi:hypothetical protein